MSHFSTFVLVECGSFNPVHNLHLRMLELTKDEIISRSINKSSKSSSFNLNLNFSSSLSSNLKSNSNLVPTESTPILKFIGLLSPVSDGYKKKGLQPFATRSKLVDLACQTSNWISLSSWEGEKPEWTPTMQVLKELERAQETLHQQLDANHSQGQGQSQRQNTKTKVQVVFVCGADVFTSFAIPGLWKDSDVEEIFKNFHVAVINRGDKDPELVLNTHNVFKTSPHLKEKVIFVKDDLNDELSSTFVRSQLLSDKSVKYLVPDIVAEYLKENKVYTEESMKINTGVELAPMVVNREEQ